MIQVYFFSVLPKEVRTTHNVKSNKRFDLLATELDNEKNVFDFIQTKKGKIGLYKQDPSSVIENPYCILDAGHFNLTAGMYNITASLFPDVSTYPLHACGYFNSRSRLKGGCFNPLRSNANDGLLFKFCDDMSAFVMISISDARGHVQNSLFNRFSEGQLDDLIAEHIDMSKQHFDYGFDWKKWYHTKFNDYPSLSLAA